ncbi:Zf-FLZ domain containing protein [Trema orientale]|uniref:Zf-FLZ domain containing protein n=1 Tax=Trema orientale TaxID=63057 RepID=A0A2P5FAW7_TREOI|nr:Zf-FLZ domain containing protein [Trema orientale]
MLRNRSRAVTSKQQALMADHSSQPSPTQNQNHNRTTPSFFGSPKFRAFTKKGPFENDGLVSPTSILDTKPFSPLSNPFSFSRNHQALTSPKIFPGNKRSWEKTEAKGISLVLIDPIPNDKTNTEDNFSKTCNRKVLLGTKLRVQIPPLPTDQSQSSPAEFGIKSRNSHVSACGSAYPSSQAKDPKANMSDWISVSDVENSEDYTCVISHGPVPRTTHIFDNCIVESYYSLSDHKSNSCPDSNFLSFCYACKKNLEEKIDIYIYRGEKAFCSRECRYQEMVLDGIGNAEFDDALRHCF